MSKNVAGLKYEYWRVPILKRMILLKEAALQKKREPLGFVHLIGVFDFAAVNLF